MTQSNVSATASRGPESTPPIQFYSVQLMPLADGRLSVGVSATLCESIDDDDFELVNMDMASARVGTVEEALAVIRDAITSVH